MKVVATIEARMTSSRLPGKVMLPVLDKPILEYLIERLKKVQQLDQIVIATTTNKTDDVLGELADRKNVGCYRGSEENVMSRVLEAAQSYQADIIVEITGDCPIIDPWIVSHAIDTYLFNLPDYLSNCIVRSFPVGMDIQIFQTRILEKSFSMTKHKLDLEHVTRHIRQNPEIFDLLHFIAPPNLYAPDISLTLDEMSDYILLKNIIEYFNENPFFHLEECLHVLKYRYPSWLKINKDVLRKGLNS